MRMSELILTLQVSQPGYEVDVEFMPGWMHVDSALERGERGAQRTFDRGVLSGRCGHSYQCNHTRTVAVLYCMGATLEDALRPLDHRNTKYLTCGLT